MRKIAWIARHDKIYSVDLAARDLHIALKIGTWQAKRFANDHTINREEPETATHRSIARFAPSLPSGLRRM